MVVVRAKQAAMLTFVVCVSSSTSDTGAYYWCTQLFVCTRLNSKC
uniref:Uncharacterized protein n=1 Tax=Anguilla anguilla TaxID=7936 RepID=A0A0E9SPY6_ANGAN